MSLINDIFKQLDETRREGKKLSPEQLCGNKLCVDYDSEKTARKKFKAFTIPLVMIIFSISALCYHFFLTGKPIKQTSKINQSHSSSVIASRTVSHQSHSVNSLSSKQSVNTAPFSAYDKFVSSIGSSLAEASSLRKKTAMLSPQRVNTSAVTQKVSIDSVAHNSTKKSVKMIIRPATVAHLSGQSIDDIEKLSHSCMHCAISELESMNKADISYVRLLATLYIESQDWQASDSYLNKMVQRYPSDIVLTQLLGRSYVSRHQPEKAINVLLRFSPSIAKYPEYYNLIGMAYFQQHYFDIAESYFSQLKSFHSTNGRYWALYGFSLSAQKKYLRALKALQTATDLGGLNIRLANSVQHELNNLRNIVAITG